MIVSPSRLSAFGACARRYYYEKILNLPSPANSRMVFGSVWHFAIQVYEEYDRDIELAKNTFEHYWRNPDGLGLQIDEWSPRTTWAGLFDKGMAMLDRHHQMQPFRYGKLIGTEIEFEVPLGKHTLRGIVDKVWLRPRKKVLEVIDYKTGNWVPSHLRHNLQFTAYLYATTRPEFWAGVPGFEDGFERFKDHEREGFWLQATKNRKLEVGTRTQLDYQRLELAGDQLEAAISNDVWPLAMTGDACRYCPFVDDVCGKEKNAV